jgi:hypothetical protein
MFYDPLSVSNEEENAQNILCINDHRQWASPMFTINVNQALLILGLQDGKTSDMQSRHHLRGEVPIFVLGVWERKENGWVKNHIS